MSSSQLLTQVFVALEPYVVLLFDKFPNYFFSGWNFWVSTKIEPVWPSWLWSLLREMSIFFRKILVARRLRIHCVHDSLIESQYLLALVSYAFVFLRVFDYLLWWPHLLSFILNFVRLTIVFYGVNCLNLLEEFFYLVYVFLLCQWLSGYLFWWPNLPFSNLNFLHMTLSVFWP